jgi:Glyoxalase-like domain
MHRSAIGAFCIDLPDASFDATSAFWAGALSKTVRRGTNHPDYAVIEGGVGGLTALLQRVGDDTPRIHLDVHTDDVAAEVTRLCALGAKEVGRHDEWVILADPSGAVFCVVPTAPDDPLLADAAEYED